jgi:hypothetical protein
MKQLLIVNCLELVVFPLAAFFLLKSGQNEKLLSNTHRLFHIVQFMILLFVVKDMFVVSLYGIVVLLHAIDFRLPIGRMVFLVKSKFGNYELCDEILIVSNNNFLEKVNDFIFNVKYEIVGFYKQSDNKEIKILNMGFNSAYEWYDYIEIYMMRILIDVSAIIIIGEILK